MTLPTGSSHRGNRGRARAFTLIEFILVMALLLVVFGVSIPTLANFFRGRSLESEARRFLSLTRYGQSRAVSEGMPMLLWIDARAGAYGLEAEQVFDGVDGKAATFELAKELTIELDRARTTGLASSASRSGLRGLPMIRFQPDGFIGEGSPESIWIRQMDEREEHEIRITLSTNRLRYEIQTNIWNAPLAAR